MNREPRPAPRAAHGFTLIELLVVIAVIALLIGLLMPTLSGARRSAQSAKELAAVRQIGIGYAAYTADSRGQVVPGYLLASWARPPRPAFEVFDNPQDGSDAARLTGSVIRAYPWRLMTYIDYAADAMIVDRRLIQSIRDRSMDHEAPNNYYAALARHPSFGLNTTFIGGDAHRGAFFRPSLLRWGSFYITRLDQASFPARLLAFSSSRGILPDSGGEKVPGYHRIEAPWHATPTSTSVPAFIRWTAPPGRVDPNLPTSAYGHVDFRHAGKACTLALDLHAELLSVDQMRDMRRWSNRATGPDWRPQ